MEKESINWSQIKMILTIVSSALLVASAFWALEGKVSVMSSQLADITVFIKDQRTYNDNMTAQQSSQNQLLAHVTDFLCTRFGDRNSFCGR